ncbi:DUF4424 family protein [Bacteroidota bacterium]
MKTFILIFFVLLLSTLVYSNESPIISGSIGTGNIQFYTEEDVAIEKENLVIVFYPQRSIVQVKYDMKNYGDSKNIKVGFPHRYITESSAETESVLKDISIKKNGESLDYKIEKETDMISKEEFTEILPEEVWYLFDYQKVWTTDYLIYDLNISKDESFTMEISYEVENLLFKLESWGYMPMYTFSPYKFEYILTTGKNWKGSIIKDFDATVEFKEFDPERTELSPTQFKHSSNSNIYIWKETDFQPDKNIEIKYYPQNAEFFFNKDARFMYYLTENDDEIPDEIKDGSGARLYSIPFYFEKDFYIPSMKLTNPDIKYLDVYFEIVNPDDGKDTLIKISFDQTKRSYDFIEKKFSSNLFGIPEKYSSISQDDLKIELEYFVSPKNE